MPVVEDVANIEAPRRGQAPAACGATCSPDSDEVKLPRDRSIWGRCLAFTSTSSGRSIAAVVDQMIVSAANFLLLVAVARSVGAAATGAYVLALRTVDFASEIQNVFLWAPYTLFAPERHGESRRNYAGSVLIAQQGAGLVTVLLAGLVAVAANLLGAHTAALIASWALVGSIGIHLREFTRRICFANYDLLGALAMDAGVFFLQAVSIGYLYTTHQITGWSVLLATSASCLAGSVVALLLLRKRFSFRRADLLPSFRQNISYGRWLLGSDLVLLLSNQLYPWFLSFVAGPASVAIFSGAQALTNFARMFLIGAQNVLLPSSASAFASGNLSNLRRLVKRSTLLLTSGSAAFSLACLLAGGALIRLTYGNALGSHGLLTFLLSLSIFTTALTLAPTFALAAARRADANLRINVITLAFHCVIGLALTRLFSAEGAAYGLVSGGLLAAILRWRLYNKLLGNGKELAN